MIKKPNIFTFVVKYKSNQLKEVLTVVIVGCIWGIGPHIVPWLESIILLERSGVQEDRRENRKKRFCIKNYLQPDIIFGLKENKSEINLR